MREDDSVELSRRQFLQFSGVALLASRFDFLPPACGQLSTVENQGRALAAAAVHRAPSSAAPVVRTLWPDSIAALTGVRDGWYRTPDGWVQRDRLQPMTPYTPSETVPLPEMPFWAEVAAPAVPVRAWCAANAPLVTRIGHGGVAQVIDALPADQPGLAWYGLAGENGDLLGWTPGVRWREVVVRHVSPAPVNDHHRTGQALSLQTQVVGAPFWASASSASDNEFTDRHLTLSTGTLTGWEGDAAVFTAPAAVGAALQPGTYRVRGRQPAITCLDPTTGETRHGVPWALDLGAGVTLAGAYWHNRFGAAVPGAALHVPPALAHWLYDWLNDGSTVIIKI
jgi:hypothetical protein